MADMTLIVTAIILIVLIVYVMIMIGLTASSSEKLKSGQEDILVLRQNVNTKYKMA